MPLFSIIITVYNKAAYVEKCLLSCLRQEVSPETFEIIAVNDGSTDASSAILRRMQSAYPQIRLVEQENAGLSLAREKGAEAASGDYLWFVDADDCIAPDALCVLTDFLSEQPDVLCLQAQTLGNPAIRNALPTGFTHGMALLSDNLFEDCVPFYVYRRAFLQQHGLHFFPGIYHEDAEFTPRMLFAARKVAVCPIVLYFVYPDPQSLARLPKVKLSYDLVKVAENLHAFRVTHSMTKGAQASFSHRISKALNNALSIICKFDRREQQDFNAFMYAHREVLSELSFSFPKYRVEYVLFRLFPKHNVQMYRLLKRI